VGCLRDSGVKVSRLWELEEVVWAESVSLIRELHYVRRNLATRHVRMIRRASKNHGRDES
jgi:hypothetical protein